LLEKTDEVVLGQIRTDDEDNLEEEIKKHIPDRIVSLADRIRGRVSLQLII
jgi:hypothetical protein